MRKTKGIVVYDTTYGNTRQIAEIIAATLNLSGIEADLLSIEAVKKLSPDEYYFMVLGSPTKFGTMSLAFRLFLGKIKGEEWDSRPFAAFDTENPENIERSKAENKDWSAAEKISLKLKDKKMNQVLPVFRAAVTGQKGPLLSGEIERARDYAIELATKLKENVPV